MKLSKTIKLSVDMLIHSKLRSWLTILGVLIGVAAVVAIISLGVSMQQSVNSRLQGFGQDLITINSGSQRAFGPGEGGNAMSDAEPLSEKDIQTLKLVPGIAYINRVVSGRATLNYRGANASVSVEGYDTSVFKEFITTALESGRYFTSGDTRAVVIGYGLAHKTFRTELKVGSLLTIEDRPFRVIGILSSSSGFGGSDSAVYMSIDDAWETLEDTNLEANEFSSIVVKVSDADSVNETATNIESALRNSHHVLTGKEDFSVTSAQALQERFNSVTGGIIVFLVAIAAVSLLVGGIGVSNTMFTSVLEKTKEIGIMKAIGARNKDILMIFLFNSGLLGLVGGLFGIILGALTSYFIPYLGFSVGPQGSIFEIIINPWLLLFGVVFSTGIGMVSGVIPAYRASKLRPVDALRYE